MPDPDPAQSNEWEQVDPRERLSLALDVINRSDLSPEEKLGLEQTLLNQYDQAVSETSLSSLASPTTSEPGSSESSSPDVDYWQPSPDLNLRQEDWDSFVVE